MTRPLTDHEKQLRAIIRGFLINASREELRREMLLSGEKGDKFRASVVEELLTEEAEESRIGTICYPIDLENGEINVTVRYRLVPGEEPEILELADFSASEGTFGELVEYYLRNEPTVCDDLLAAIQENEND